MMKIADHPEKPRRRSIRLPRYDYSWAGAYFVTVCTNKRKLLFGEVIGHEVKLNEIGKITAEEWLKSAQVRTEIELDAWVVMPNHMHGIVMIKDDRGRNDRAAASRKIRPKSLSALVAGFKAATTTRINIMRGTPGMPVWHRNYYEHVIRNESVLDQIREYIVNNPIKWSEDPQNPAAIAKAGTRRPRKPWMS